MKVTFVIPNLAGGKHFLQPPLDTLYGLSILNEEGHECTFVDNRVHRLSFDELIENLPESDVFVVNTAPYDFSQMYHFDYHLAYSIATTNKIKQAHPHTPMILSGIHVNVRPQQMMSSTNADIALLGEVKMTLPRWLQLETKALIAAALFDSRSSRSPFLRPLPP